MTDVMMTRCTLSDVRRRLLRWMSRSMYTSASTKHSGLQDAYLFILQERRRQHERLVGRLEELPAS